MADWTTVFIKLLNSRSKRAQKMGWLLGLSFVLIGVLPAAMDENLSLTQKIAQMLQVAIPTLILPTATAALNSETLITDPPENPNP